MEYLSYDYGLTGLVDPVSENGQLFLATLILLIDYERQFNPIPDWMQELYNLAVATMFVQLERSKVESGLYHRNRFLIDRRVMSHDNMSGVMNFCSNKPTKIHKDIWSYLVKHFFIYDNTKGRSSQFSRLLPFNPSNIFAWGLTVESFWSQLFIIIYFPSLILQCHKPVEDTTGKILTWVELVQFKKHWLAKHCWEYFNLKMFLQYGPNAHRKFIRYYHRDNGKDFPIIKVLDYFDSIK